MAKLIEINITDSHERSFSIWVRVKDISGVCVTSRTVFFKKKSNLNEAKSVVNYVGVLEAFQEHNKTK